MRMYMDPPHAVEDSKKYLQRLEEVPTVIHKGPVFAVCRERELRGNLLLMAGSKGWWHENSMQFQSPRPTFE